jgi:serine/threonine-protein kinase RsbW/stage II sporulation protein AB (anti-sigma F factor)
MRGLLLALRARAADHPESPGLIASWPGVPEARMTAACGELRRQGHAVHEVSIARPEGKVRSGWALGGTTYRAVVTPAPPAGLGYEDAVLVREVAEPSAVSLARGVLTGFAERSGAPKTVRSAIAVAVTEACANVVSHAYVGRDAPGELEVRACVADRVLVVEVADEGCGMVPRVDSPGLGLGLPLIAQSTDMFEILEHVERSGVVLRMRFNLAGSHGAAT